ncbi:hypothetical protein T265_08948 [Opisthorchis viverrini]|uniref:Uncharacterized protein n=1 Tax=Opisthorchis viverrini TaxID=6198 RepID=A0A075A6M4_OPIVI|nr:hypothetical protein T265_08948 [Opisthorchis viverrini]KER23094.1 hypothetical protein T265_08948 [Opisthorchis viverrini]
MPDDLPPPAVLSPPRFSIFSGSFCFVCLENGSDRSHQVFSEIFECVGLRGRIWYYQPSCSNLDVAICLPHQKTRNTKSNLPLITLVLGRVSVRKNGEIAQWLERESTDRKVRGSNRTSASRLPLSRLGQPDSISAHVLS